MLARGSLVVLVGFVLPLALLSACGDDSASSAADPADSSSSAAPSDPASESASASEPGSSDTASPLPEWAACADVWVKDAELPARYQGCLDGDTAVAADNLGCSSGQRIVRYEDQFFAVAGGSI